MRKFAKTKAISTLTMASAVGMYGHVSGEATFAPQEVSAVISASPSKPMARVATATGRSDSVDFGAGHAMSFTLPEFSIDENAGARRSPATAAFSKGAARTGLGLATTSAAETFASFPANYSVAIPTSAIGAKTMQSLTISIVGSSGDSSPLITLSVGASAHRSAPVTMSAAGAKAPNGIDVKLGVPRSNVLTLGGEHGGSVKVFPREIASMRVA